MDGNYCEIHRKSFVKLCSELGINASLSEHSDESVDSESGENQTKSFNTVMERLDDWDSLLKIGNTIVPNHVNQFIEVIRWSACVALKVVRGCQSVDGMKERKIGIPWET